VVSKLCFEILKMSHSGIVLVGNIDLGGGERRRAFFAAVPALTPMWGGDEGEKCRSNSADTGDGGGIGGGEM